MTVSRLYNRKRITCKIILDGSHIADLLTDGKNYYIDYNDGTEEVEKINADNESEARQEYAELYDLFANL